MRVRVRTVFETAAWLLPAAVLVVSGIAKLVAPQGAIPPALTWLTGFVPYTLLLRFLGAFEVLVAGHLVVPRTRRLGALVALGLLVGFSLLIAANAYDQDFLRNCGCFGGLEAGGAIGPFSGAGIMLLRNALLCGLLAVSLLAARTSARVSWGIGLGAAALVFFATGFVAEQRLAHYDRVVDAVLKEARHRTMFRLPLPEIGLVAANGDTTTSARVLREGDHTMFFAPSCPHCRDQAPAWAAFARQLERRGGRLVLLAVDDSAGVRDFKREFGCDSLESYYVPERVDPLRWAIESIPQMIVIGPGGRLAYHEQQRAGAGLSGSVATTEVRVHGLAPETWRRIAEALAGPGTVLESSRQHGDLHIARGHTRRGEPVEICVGTIFGTPTHVIEIAVGLDERRRVLGIFPLSAGGYARVVDPQGQLLEPLAGMSLEEAARDAERRGRETTMEAPVWESAGVLLGALADVLPPEPPAR